MKAGQHQVTRDHKAKMWELLIKIESLSYAAQDFFPLVKTHNKTKQIIVVQHINKYIIPS